MKTQEMLEQQKEEIEDNLKGFEKCRDKLLRSGIAVEYDIPVSDRKEFRDLILDFLNKKVEVEEFNRDEIISSIAYYEY